LSFFEKSKNFYWIGILTNGTLINSTIVNKLKEYSKLSEIQISIDGSTAKIHDKIRGDGSFAKAINSIKILKKHGFFISIMFTLHKKNREEAIPMLELAENLAVDAITIERITPMNKNDIKKFYLPPKELHEIYNKIYKKKLEIEERSKLKVRVSRPLWTLIDGTIGGFCPAGLTCLAILYDGTVLPCRRLEIPIGNILKDGLFKIWYTSSVLWRLRNKKNLMGNCNNCRYLYSCGGCRAIAYTVNGDYMAEDPQCWLIERKGGYDE
jgi:radical SAM protein with 4Fe4S-binding SPASM domain